MWSGEAGWLIRTDRANGLERLRELETELGEAGWSAGRDEWVRRGFEGRKSRADDEEGTAEAAERPVHSRGPEHQGANAVYAQADDECPSVAELPHDPPGIGQWSDEVRSEVGALEALYADGQY